MKAKLLAAAAAAFALATAGTAAASVVFSASHTTGLNDVHSSGTQTGTTVYGDLLTAADFFFTSSQGLATNGSGVAQINTDGVPPDTGFNSIDFGTVSGADFSAITFSLMPLNVKGPVLPVYVDFYVGLNGAFTLVQDNYSLGTGENKFSLIGNSGSVFDTVRLSMYADTSNTTTEGIDSLRQVSVGDLSLGGIPEPATWGMMIMGFGGIGAMVRRRRSHPALAAA